MIQENNSNGSLAGQAARLQAILESAADAIIAIDGQGIITAINPAAEKLFRYSREEFIGRNVDLLMPDPYHSEHDRYIRRYHETGERRIIGIGREVTGRRSDGSLFPMHLAVSEFEIDGEIHFTGIVRDLSAHKATEQALRQSQKMEALGQLTGGIAHDFNNLLTVIVGNLEMLETRLTTPDQKDLASEALEAAEVGARLTSRLLAFARRSYLEPEIVNLNTFVLGLTDMLHRTLGETVLLSTSLSPELWTVRADTSQVESAIVNLAVNSRDAMPNGGRLLVETGNAEIEADHAAGLEDLPSGDYVRLSVSDTGSGMSKEVREQAFEPFFTTKEKGRGTGLGLSMVYGFVRQSGGHVTIYSEEGRGTTVNLYLPQHQSEMDASAPVEEAGTEPGNGELILAVEDDPKVRRLTIARLGQLGYRVLEAASGREALDVLVANPNVDLLFTDLVMPGGMSGLELSIEAQKRFPHLKTLLTSGYAEDLALGDRPERAHLRLLRKPYRLADLAAAVSETLGG